MDRSDRLDLVRTLRRLTLRAPRCGMLIAFTRAVARPFSMLSYYDDIDVPYQDGPHAFLRGSR